MAIEIRELKIKGFINKNKTSTQNPSLSGKELANLKRSIVKDCTKEVLNALERKYRR